MPKVNLFLSIPSPRNNIDAVLQYQEKLPVDKFLPLYYFEWPAYDLARMFFLEHKEYTHFVTATDDIVVKPEHIIQLKKDLEKHDYPILTGVMNVEETNPDILNICYNVPHPQWVQREYFWINKKDLPKSIFKVGFSGFPLFCIRRDIIQKIPFDSDGLFNEMQVDQSGSLDVMYCWNADRLGIPIYVDPKIHLLHLRRQGKHRTHGPDKIDPDWWFVPMGGRMQKMPMRAPQLFKKKIDAFIKDNGYEQKHTNQLILTMANIIYDRLMAEEERIANETP